MTLPVNPMEFPSLTHRSIWQAAMSLAPFREVIPQELSQTEADALCHGEASFHRFVTDMYGDMYRYPEAYGIPVGEYDVYMNGRERRRLGHKGDPKESRLRNQFQQAIQFYPKFLFELGMHGVVEGDAGINFAAAILDDLINRHNLRLIRGTQEQRLAALERLGMIERRSDGRVYLRNKQYPWMFTALTALARANREKLALTHVLRCDFRGLQKGFKPGLEDAISILPEAFRRTVLQMDEVMQSIGAKITVQPLKNTTLYSPWKVSYTQQGKSIYGFHAEPQRLEVYLYFNRPENITGVAFLLKAEDSRIYDWFSEHIPIRECRCPNNRLVDIGGEKRRICGLMNRLEVENPDALDLEYLKRIIDMNR